MKTKHDVLFAYGTLMQGFTNSYARMLHQHSRFLGRGHFPGRLYSRGAYPVAVYNVHSAEFVYGELFALSNPEILAALDQYEGIGPESEKHTPEYQRIRIVAFMDDGSPVLCWAYVNNADVEGLPHLPSGDYRDYA